MSSIDEHKRQIIEDNLRRELNLFEQNLLDECTFGDAVFNEVLRMYPPVPADVRFVNQDMTLPSGHKIKRKMRVHFPIFGCGRNPYYWENADTFLPTRWIDPKTNKCKKIDPVRLPVFWALRRECLGKNVARYEFKVLLYQIIKNDLKINVKPHKEIFINAPNIFIKGGLPSTVTSF